MDITRKFSKRNYVSWDGLSHTKEAQCALAEIKKNQHSQIVIILACFVVCILFYKSKMLFIRK